jgi:hypothetical protein
VENTGVFVLYKSLGKVNPLPLQRSSKPFLSEGWMARGSIPPGGSIHKGICMTDRKHICDKCGNSFSNRGGNYSKHMNVCDGVYKKFEKSTKCKWCQIPFEGLNTSERANHSRWCRENPSLDAYNAILANMRANITEASRKKQASGVMEAHKNGKYEGAAIRARDTRILKGNTKHTEETKELIRQKALASNHRRVLRSSRKYTMKDGTEVLLDSSWEEALAIRLDSLNIKWIRPESVEWVDNAGKTHNYFPDFYLVEYDMYLDPKNDIVHKMSIDKIEKVSMVLPNLKIIRSLEECKNFST